MSERWVRYHPDYCPEAVGSNYREWDTSHDISIITEDGERRRVGTIKHASWAAEICEAMNARPAQED